MTLNGLKLISMPAKPDVPDTQKRRFRLIQNISKQIDRVNQVRHGSKPRGVWWWRGTDNAYVLPIKYGRYPLDLGRGRTAIECADFDQIIVALEKAEAAAVAGAFDEQLEALSVEIRKRFKPKNE